MSKARRSRAFALAAAALVLVLNVGAGDVEGVDRDTAAGRFIATVLERLQVAPVACDELPDVPDDAVACGTIGRSDLDAGVAAEAVALGLAERGVRVLRGLPSSNKAPWLAALPGLAPIKRPGFSGYAFLIETHRVLVWTPAGSRSLFFIVERLEGPFPEVFPAVVPAPR